MSTSVHSIGTNTLYPPLFTRSVPTAKGTETVYDNEVPKTTHARAKEPAFGIKCLCPLLGKLWFLLLLLFVFVPRLNTPVSLSVPEMAGIIYMPRGVGGEGGESF